MPQPMSTGVTAPAGSGWSVFFSSPEPEPSLECTEAASEAGGLSASRTAAGRFFTRAAGFLPTKCCSNRLKKLFAFALHSGLQKQRI